MIITLLRKPLEGSVAENTLQHGCGAINIDATRVTTTDNLNGGAYAENPTELVGEYEQPSGRWPANFMLTHLEGCKLVGTKKVKSDGNHTYKTPQDGGTIKLGLKDLPSKGNPHADEDGKKDVADWACVEGCLVQELDRQSGHLKSGKMGAESYQMWGVNGIYGGGKEHPATYYGDEGGASRFFMQFKKGDDQ
jgi:hypothetical protein